MKNVFFSFHYENDITRSMVVRNSWIIKGNKEAGFIDKAEFEELKKKGTQAVKNWIDGQLEGTSTTIVLIGEETSKREFIKYELQRSYERGNKIIGIYIHNIKDLNGKTSIKGDTYFGTLGKDYYGKDVYFSTVAETYDWVLDNGYDNLGKWIEKAHRN